MATKYIHFTDEQKEKARQTNLYDLLRAQGETLKRSGSEYEWMDGSQKVTIRGNLWFHQYERQGGNAIDFVRRFYHMDYPQAVSFLLNGEAGTIPVSQQSSSPSPPKPFTLPERSESMRRVYAYLLGKRGLDREVVRTFVGQNMIYESAQYHNAVFVGYDPYGIPRHANLRGIGSESTFKGNADGSIPEYSFHRIGKSERIYLFEAPIDMLSFISLHKPGWQQHSYAAACCVSGRVLFQTIKDYSYISEIFLCMDNDEPGQKTNRRIAEQLFMQGIHAQILVPQHKDWNEDLLYAKESEAEDPCQALQL